MIWHTFGPVDLGYIPDFLLDQDERPAREQINERYAHGGGWQPLLAGWKMSADGRLSYPGDPTMPPVARTKLREEEIFVYPYAWVAIRQPDGSFEVARLD